MGLAKARVSYLLDATGDAPAAYHGALLNLCRYPKFKFKGLRTCPEDRMSSCEDLPKKRLDRGGDNAAIALRVATTPAHRYAAVCSVTHAV